MWWEKRKHNCNGLDDFTIRKTFRGSKTGIDIQHIVSKPGYNLLEIKIQKKDFNIIQILTAEITKKSIIILKVLPVTGISKETAKNKNCIKLKRNWEDKSHCKDKINPNLKYFRE